MKIKRKFNLGLKPTEIIYLALSFLIPFLILGTVFAIYKVSPFGGRLVMYSDIEHSEFPSYSSMWYKLRAGDILSTWSWTAGLGTPNWYPTIFLSPLNLLIMIVPYAWLSEAVTLLALVKIGLTGLFTGIYLRYAFRQCGPALPVFSSLFALCAYRIGYFHFLGSLDTIALLPLVMTGYLALIKKDKYRLYVISLALAVIYNFYIAFFICLFVAMTFLSQCIIQKLNRREVLQKFCLTAVCSVLALGMTVFFIIPAIVTLPQSTAVKSIFPTTVSLYHSFFSILGNFIAFTQPSLIDGLPNLYCGFISVMLIGLFIYSSKISLREKIVFMGIFVFLLVCCNVNVLSYIIHGFRNPNFLPSRFSFLISFMLVGMAYRMFLIAETMGWREIAVISISAAIFLLSAGFGSQRTIYIILSAVLCAIYLLLLYKMSSGSKIVPLYKIAFLLIVLGELFLTVFLFFTGVAHTFLRRTYFFQRNELIHEILDLRQPEENDFYRTEIDLFLNYNQTLLFNYNGITSFSTGINENLRRFAEGLGMPYFINGFFYSDVTPFFNSLFNLRYLISNVGYRDDKNPYWEKVGEVDSAVLLENKKYLPLGFMVNEKLADYNYYGAYNPYQTQSDFFSLATGLDERLFIIPDITFNKGQTQELLTLDFKVQDEGMYFCSLIINTKRTNYNVFVNGELVRSLVDMSSCVFPIGNLLQGDEVSIHFSSGYDNIHYMVCRLNDTLFEQGYEILASQPLHLTKFSNTQICGYVTALSDGLLYTSIPADRNWSVFVDGVKSETVLIGNALIAVPLSEGTHQIEFRYFNKAIVPSAIISLVSIALFVLMIIVRKRCLTSPTACSDVLQSPQDHSA